MAVIDFLPDRLNNPPVVWKGFTSGEFLLAAIIGVVAGIPWRCRWRWCHLSAGWHFPPACC